MLPPQRPGVYVRISKDVAGLGLGVERQRRECETLRQRLGWGEATVFEDNDLSAFSGRRRPAYEAMLAAVKDGTCDGILSWAADRLTRRPIELEGLISVADGAGVPIATVQGGEIDLSSPAGRLFARQLGSVARYESEHKSQRLQSKHMELVAAGRPNGGPAGLGYRRGNGSLVIEPSEANEIRRAAADVLSGLPMAHVATRWTAEGLPTPRGGSWTTGAVRRVLSSPRVAGLREHRGEITGKGNWDPILDTETHARLQAFFASPNRRQAMKQRQRLLTGLMLCGRCGERMNAARRNGRANYVDPLATTYKCKSCGIGTGSAQIVETVVIDSVLKRLDSADFRSALADADAAAADDSGDLLAEIALAEAELADLAAAVSAGKVRASVLISAGEAIEARLSYLRARLGRSSGSGAAAEWLGRGETLRQRWEDLEPQAQRAVIESVVGSIEVAPVGRGARWAASPEGMARRLTIHPR